MLKKSNISPKLVIAASISLCAIICIVLSYFWVPKKPTQAPYTEDIPAIPAYVQQAKLTANKNPVEGFCEEEADQLRAEILGSSNTEELYQITGTKYYISAAGDDKNDGLSPEKPIKTLARLREIYMVDGDAVLFKRGDIFRFGESLKTRSGVIYGSYGEGEKPKIYGSPENYAESDSWQNEGGHIWKIPFNYSEACGLVINHSEIIGINKHMGLRTMNSNGDYMHDTENGIFYLYCDKGNPCEAFDDIEIMPSFTLISANKGNGNVIIDNLCLKYTSGFGIHTANAGNFSITNCEIGFTGGKWLNNDRKLRYGNAIEIWGGAHDVTVKNNWIYQTYDSAFTWQGNSGGSYKNIVLSHNLFEYNNADIEFFDRNGSIAEDFVIEDNIMRFTSMGWGTRKEDGGIRGIEGCIRGVTGTRGTSQAMNIKSIHFIDNIIDTPARQIISWNWDLEQKEFINTSGTKLYINSALRTLDACLQGLQTQDEHPYDYRFATNESELIEGFEIFEEGADIHWE